jgi:hypothetical protein
MTVVFALHLIHLYSSCNQHDHSSNAAIAAPTEWTTGGDAATQKQKAYIAVLEKRAGEGVHDLGGLTKGEASERIEALRERTSE